MNVKHLMRKNYLSWHQNVTISTVRYCSGLQKNANMKFSRSKVGDFMQEQPSHENAYLADRFMVRNLERIMPFEVINAIKDDLLRFGHRVSSDIWKLGQECAANEPFLHKTSAWGQKIDALVTCEAWKRQKIVSAEEGLIAIAYERNFNEFSRLYQAAKLYMYSPSSGLYSCPLAMTDGAAKTIEANNLISTYQNIFGRLTSRDPEQFWTSGQWMTEKRGGSDVANGTETIAVPVPGNQALYHLYGYKWFSSATDSDIALTLARIADQNGRLTAGGVTMFLLKTKEESGALNGIEVVKLKNKLGTRQLPTGELLIEGAVAERMSPPGRGIACISSMLTITRLHNVISSVAGPRKLLHLARDYATKREAFGHQIRQHYLHLQALARMETEIRGCTVLMFDLAHKLGLDDCGLISDEDLLLLRLITPVAKMYTAKRAVELTSEGLECFGGQGYIEDTGLPAFLRDAQVLPIWEGTSSVMSLDLLRAIQKTKGEALKAFKSRISRITTSGLKNPELKECCLHINSALEGLLTFVRDEPSKMEIAGRDFATSVAHTYVAALLVDHANYASEKINDSEKASDILTVRNWMQRDLAPVVTQNKRGAYDVRLSTYNDFVYEGYDEENLTAPTFLR